MNVSLMKDRKFYIGASVSEIGAAADPSAAQKKRRRSQSLAAAAMAAAAFVGTNATPAASTVDMSQQEQDHPDDTLVSCSRPVSQRLGSQEELFCGSNRSNSGGAVLGRCRPQIWGGNIF